MSEQPTTTPRLERETCPRCGGSGHYSYCQSHGTICFKCGGKKEVLTKRGAIAAAFLKGLRTKKVRDLKVGDKIKYDGIQCSSFNVKGGWTTVTAIRPGEVARDGGRVIDGKVVPVEVVVETPLCTFQTSFDREFEVLFSKEEQLAQLQQVLAFQATLTKAGTPRKR